MKGSHARYTLNSKAIQVIRLLTKPLKYRFSSSWVWCYEILSPPIMWTSCSFFYNWQKKLK